MAYKSNSFMFRDLTDVEETEFRKWARDNFDSIDPVQDKKFNLYHPVVREEYYKIEDEKKID